MSDVLLVDDDSELIQSLARVLSTLIDPRSVSATASVERASRILSVDKPLVVVLDLCLDERIGVESGFALLSMIAERDSTARVIVLTGHGSAAHGIRALQMGAASFVEKPANPEHIAALIKDACCQAELRRELLIAKNAKRSTLDKSLIGSSDVMRQLREQIDFAASISKPILLTGETGTGKSFSARLIHDSGERRTKNFVHYHPNFGSGDLVQGELFGHVKGSFTGAIESRRGLALEADGGTLFIDELDEMTQETQVRLLDLLQEHRVRPIGADSYTTVQCRFIAATNRPIADALESGKIRRDLHHRLAHCHIALPPLRTRLSDIPELVAAMLDELRAREGIHVFEVSEGALDACRQHSWPGNVRELQGAIERAALYAHYKGRRVVARDDLGAIVRLDAAPALSQMIESFHSRVEDFKRKLVQEALTTCEGNQLHAARLLRVDRGTIRRLSSSR
jgi:two-component system response regulator AtoC